MKYDIIFVILHFIAVNDTIEAIDSIKEKLSNSCNYRIVVVDNGSNDSSGQKLLAKYCNDVCIDVIINEVNLGFSKGNNVGIRYVNENFETDFIAVINNDTMIVQSDFFDIIITEYRQSKFGILGPMVLTADGMNSSSPVFHAPTTYNSIEKNLKREKKLYLLEKIYLQEIYVLINKIISRFFSRKNSREVYNYDNRFEDVVLHGCCLIFSKDFFKYFSGFDEATFLYHEEEILYLKAKSVGLKMVYNPLLKIYHKEDMASNAMLPAGHTKRLFKLKHCISSSTHLLGVCEEVIKIVGANDEKEHRK